MTTRKRAKKPSKERTQKNRYRRERILFGRSRRGPRPIYDPEVHPAELIAHFQEIHDAVKEVEAVVTKQGDVKHVLAPVIPPTLAGYAAKIGVTRETLWAWGEKCETFKDAIDRAKAIQEQVYVTMGALGAYNPNVAIFMLKNHQAWTDKSEQTHKGAVNLKFDKQDADA